MKEKIRKAIMDAYKNVPLYFYKAQQLGIDVDVLDIENIPFTHKEDFMNEDLCVAASYSPDLHNNRLLLTTTSGYSGKCLSIYKNDADNRRSLAELWIRRKQYYGINPNDRFCYFYTTGLADEKEYNGVRYCIQNNSLCFCKDNLNEEHIKVIYGMMMKFKPVWMTIQPSIMSLIISCIKKNNLSPLTSVKYVEFTGEELNAKIREDTVNYFNCYVANQYGCHEMNSIAYECPEGNMHVMESNVWLEIISEGGKQEDGCEGEICLTSLNNKVMPFIRYFIGDKGMIICNKSCPCGNKSAILKLTQTRSMTQILMEDGSKINRYVMLKPIEIINQQFGIIKQFQILQEYYNEFTIRLALDMEKLEEVGMEIVDIPNYYIELIQEDRLKNAKFRFEISDMLFSNEKTGKFESFLTYVKTTK